MSAPKDFQSAIEDKYGEFGWELANCFCFIAKYKGYKVRDFSSIESALKLIDEIEDDSMAEYGFPTDMSEYLTEKYRLIHNAFIERAENIQDNDSTKEQERKDGVIEEFIDNMIGKKLIFGIVAVDEFFVNYVKDTLKKDVLQWLPLI